MVSALCLLGTITEPLGVASYKLSQLLEYNRAILMTVCVRHRWATAIHRGAHHFLVSYSGEYQEMVFGTR